MANYTEAKSNAIEALKLQNTLENLNDYVDDIVNNTKSYPENLKDKEVILA